jgi:hypothetical protein
MLWYKGWLETRFRLLFLLGFASFLVVFLRSVGVKPPPPGSPPLSGLPTMLTSFTVVVFAMLAGAGINTQPAIQAGKGLHGSTLFTLSLPVSRFKLLLVRASIGWIEMSGLIGALCLGLWFAVPMVQATMEVGEIFEFAGTMVFCASAPYCLSVLLGTLLDDQWRTWGSMIAFGALWLASSYLHLPASVDIVRAMETAPPLIAHTMPWATMAFSVGLAAILFCTALKIARTREY